ncbi:MAG: hypothetical protein Hyperionvirus27_16 [Hyperionvirus sp.]|uniref:Uncharacterized protein n=1 Tax=Hyperionvirus sp. TaxID=2487770 RepID=A0A3G5AB89_9VIRU|nr:MAG: hypothetical protein Hyperionvirus27_16 [Hyperionvirus sp.]
MNELASKIIRFSDLGIPMEDLKRERIVKNHIRKSIKPFLNEAANLRAIQAEMKENHDTLNHEKDPVRRGELIKAIRWLKFLAGRNGLKTEKLVNAIFNEGRMKKFSLTTCWHKVEIQKLIPRLPIAIKPTERKLKPFTKFWIPRKMLELADEKRDIYFEHRIHRMKNHLRQLIRTHIEQGRNSLALSKATQRILNQETDAVRRRQLIDSIKQLKSSAQNAGRNVERVKSTVSCDFLTGKLIPESPCKHRKCKCPNNKIKKLRKEEQFEIRLLFSFI